MSTYRLALGLLALLPPAFGAHGGVYRGPGSTVGPGGATAGGAGAASAGAADTDPAGWSLWWGLNRDRFLNLKDAIFGELVVTGTDDFFLGHGERSAERARGRPGEAAIRAEVVPALLGALEGAKDVDLITGTLLALAKIGEGSGDPAIAPVLRTYLRHKNQEVHETAAVALGVLAAPESAPLLVDVLLDTPLGQAHTGRPRVPYRTRAFAAYGLGLIGYRSTSEAIRAYAVHSLAKALDAPPESTVDVPVACVLSLGLVRLADGALPEGNGAPEPGEPLAPSRSRQAQIRYLLDLYAAKTTDRRVRAHIPVAVARLAHGAEPSLKDEATPLFTAGIARRSREDAIVQQGIVHGLALLGDDDDDPEDVAIRAALKDAVEDGGRLARHLALLALARTAGRRGESPAGPALADVRGYLALRLGRGTTLVRPWAGLALGMLERGRQDLGEIAAPESLLALRAALEDAAGPVERGAYATALGLTRDAGAAELLRPYIVGEDENLRGQAAVALGLIGDRASIPALQAVVTSDLNRYRAGLLREAAIALALLGDREASDYLVERLESASHMMEQVSFASALGFVGDAKTIPALVEIVKDERRSETTRAFSAVALGIICDKESLPWSAKLAADVSWWEAPTTLIDPGGGKGILDLL